jgi:predicted NUDIX family phosphoesterase
MKDRYKGEKILVFPKTLFDELGYFNGTSSDTKRYMDKILQPGHNHFHLRTDAESDPSLNQIIRYQIFKYNDTVFSYVRGKKAGETRLVGNRSIGIGGHVNPVDRQTAGDESEDLATYMEAVKREISEEVVVEENFNPIITALLNDDSNEVGKVHFGVIHVCELTGPNVRKKEQQITESGFIPIADLAGSRNDELESWSQIAIKLLS